LPQGSLKKIELQLLLPDLALQFRNPPLGGRKIVRDRRGSHRRRRRRHPFGGRPRPRKAAAPPARNRSRQTCRSFRRTCSSRANALTFSPASIRRITESFSSRLKIRADLGIQFSS